MSNQLYPILPRVVDTNINASPGAKLTFYVSGTTTPLTVYTTEACDIPHASPLVANADGSIPAVWLPTGAAKVVVTDAADASMFTIDPVVATAGGGLSASDIAFSATVELPFTNVQDAIVGAAASAASGYGVFGLGITGNATLLSNIDATNIGAGAYRFDGTTTGTYPTGVAAADGGIVEHWRQASGAAMQMIYHATTDRIFHRRMAASTWGTWRENITSNQGAVEGDILYRGASAWTRLAKGTAGQYLRQNAGLTAPEWAAAPGWTLVSDSTTWTGGKQTITGLGGYRRVMVSHVLTTADSADNRILRVGDAGGILSTSIYQRQQGAATTSAIIGCNNVTAALSGSVTIENFNTTEPYKPIIGAPERSGTDTAVGVLTSVVLTQIEVLNAAGNITGGRLLVWGAV